MLQFNFCRFDRSTERKTAPSTVITAEGQALVVDNSVSNAVKPSTGAASDIFAGVAISQQISIQAFPQIETLVVGSGNTITLSYTPIAGTLLVMNGATTLTAGTPAGNPTQYSIAGNVVTFDSSLVGTSIYFAYRFAPTVVQSQALQGDILPGGNSGAILNAVGVLLAGDVYTSEYDTTADWSGNPTVVTLAANGLFTVGGSGITVPNARLLEAPTADQPFLGLSIGNNG